MILKISYMILRISDWRTLPSAATRSGSISIGQEHSERDIQNIRHNHDGGALRSWGKNLGQGHFHFMRELTERKVVNFILWANLFHFMCNKFHFMCKLTAPSRSNSIRRYRRCV
jgi:hypothetical protein